MTDIYLKDPLKWVSLATEKPAKRPYEREHQREFALTPHVVGNMTLAADGFRLHIAHQATDPAPDELAKMPNIKPILKAAKAGNVRGRISKYHLLAAARACKVFAKESANIMRLSLNGSIQCSASSAEYGDVTVELIDGDEWEVKWQFANSPAHYRSIKKHLGELETYDGAVIKSRVVYTHTGDDILTAVDYRYLMDALNGLPEVVEYRMSGRDRPIYLSGKVDSVLREAVIMPMHLGR